MDKSFNNEHDAYHVNVIRGPLTRNIALKLEEVQEELAEAFTDEVPLEKGIVFNFAKIYH